MPNDRVLTHEQARSFYDWFGAKQDLQRFYDTPAIEALLRLSMFESASAVAEFGCGTGRLAEQLLRDRLPAHATYTGFDISSTMVELARARLKPWADRAQVQQTEGSPGLPLCDGACDRFVSTYVLDLLSNDEIYAVLREARRVMAPGGRLCLLSLTFGHTAASRLVTCMWSGIHSVSPWLAGGCRPLHLENFIRPEWSLLQREVVCTFGISSEVLVASCSPEASRH